MTRDQMLGELAGMVAECLGMACQATGLNMQDAFEALLMAGGSALAVMCKGEYDEELGRVSGKLLDANYKQACECIGGVDPKVQIEVDRVLKGAMPGKES